MRRCSPHASYSCGRRACCAWCGSRSATRSKTCSAITVRRSSCRFRACTPRSRRARAAGGPVPAHGQLDRRRPRRQSQCRRRDPQDGGIPPGRGSAPPLLVEIHQLGGELSVSRLLVGSTPSCRRSPTVPATKAHGARTSPTGAQPAGIYARLDGTLRSLTGVKRSAISFRRPAVCNVR